MWPVWLHFLIWPEDISIMGRNPPEESEATNLNRVATPHDQTLQKNQHYQKCWKLVVAFKSFSSMRILRPKIQRSGRWIHPSVVKWYWRPGWFGCVFRSEPKTFHFSAVNIQTLNLLTHQLPAASWTNVLNFGEDFNIISCWTFLYNDVVNV